MAAGPIFLRELVTSPRRASHFVFRAAFAGLFFVLVWTAWQAIVGFEAVRRLGDYAAFFATVFPLFARVQLVLAIFLAALYGASSISTEKDRRTLVLLMMTRLLDREIVVEKFLCGMLQVTGLLLATLPIFMFLALLGGVAPAEILQTYAATFGAALFASAVGVIVAAWRDKTFQAVALTLIAVMLWLLGVELLVGALGADRPVGGFPLADWAAWTSPFRAIDPTNRAFAPAYGFLIVSSAAAAFLLTVAVVRLRSWYPTGEPIMAREPDARDATDSALAVAKKPKKYREVVGNPVLWREIRTRGYGTRPILVKLGFLAICAVVLAMAWKPTFGRPAPRTAENADGEVVVLRDAAADAATHFALTAAMVTLSIVGLMLVNTQAVTAITAERDLKALDLLLATRVTPPEFVFGKMLGIWHNCREMLLAPVALIVAAAVVGLVDGWSAAFSAVVFLTFAVFATILGIHAALRYDTSRLAIAHSLGTMFLLFVGILVCLFLILVSGNDRFGAQWASFLLFIVLGSVGLWVSLSANAPSNAIGLTSAVLPFATFYCVVAFVVADLTGPLFCFLVATAAYGFAIAALLVPLLAEFDVATGRTSHAEGE